MTTHFAVEFFRGNRERLRTLFTGTAPIVLTAAGQLQRSGDAAYPFHQDTSFWYLTGIEDPDVTLVLDKDKEYLILPEHSDYQKIFDGHSSAEILVRQSGITEVLTHKEGWKRLAARLTRVKHVATLAAGPAFLDTYGIYTNPARTQLIERLKNHQPEVELLDLRQHLARMRSVKQPAELAAISSAIKLTEKALKLVKNKLDSYRYEYEVEADIVASFIKHGAESAWKPIVATGINTCLLHYHDNKAAVNAGQLLLIDVGAQVDHYVADITRTWSMGGAPTRRQQQVIEAVFEVQQFATQQLKPGTIIADYEKRIEQFMGEKLRALGLIKVINTENVRHYFPHATSHFLGLDPHDPGDYKLPLESGMVLTVEPGIYIPEETIGVRIEDDFVITDSGCQPLSTVLSEPAS